MISLNRQSEYLYCICGEAVTVITRDDIVTAYHLTAAPTHGHAIYCPMCGVKLDLDNLVELGELE